MASMMTCSSAKIGSFNLASYMEKTLYEFCSSNNNKKVFLDLMVTFKTQLKAKIFLTLAVWLVRTSKVKCLF